ncbi:hypothetical protein H7R52_04450 [Weissella confusa]|uniref:MFS transporter n=1 Tax=Weissella confusa TaxID=1583 RepID=A0A923NHF0_WEICO|nr:hypothetical protein [Weissella confusa]
MALTFGLHNAVLAVIFATFGEVGNAFMMLPATTYANNQLPDYLITHGSAMISTARQFAGVVGHIGLIVMTVLMPLYYQNVLHTSKLVSGLLMVPPAALMAVMNRRSGKLLDQKGLKVVMRIGAASIFIIAMVLFGIQSLGHTTMPISMIAMMMIGLVLSVYFVHRQGTMAQPMLDFKIFKQAGFTLGLLLTGASMVMGAALATGPIVSGIISQWFNWQGVFVFFELVIGVLFLVNLFVGQNVIVKKEVHLDIPSLIGLFGEWFLAGIQAMFLLGTFIAINATGFGWVIFGRVLEGAAVGFLFPSYQSVIMLITPEENRGASMGMVGSLFVWMLLLTSFSFSISQSAMTTIYPVMASHFSVPISMVQWLTTGFMLVMTVTMPLSPWILNRVPFYWLFTLLVSYQGNVDANG